MSVVPKRLVGYGRFFLDRSPDLIAALQFKSWGAYLDYAEPDVSSLIRSKSDSFFREDGIFSHKNVMDDESLQTWLMSNTWEQARDLARTGWTEGAEQLHPIMSLNKTDLLPRDWKRNRMEVVHQGKGHTHMGAFLTGSPYHIMHRQRQHTGNRVLRVEVPGCFQYTVNTRQVNEFGARVLSWIKQIEMNGVGCEVVLISALQGCFSQMRQKSAYIEVTVKRSNSPINVSRMAFALGHPSSFRRIGLSIIENMAKNNGGGVGDGYGLVWADPRSASSPGTVRLANITQNMSQVDREFRIALGVNPLETSRKR